MGLAASTSEYAPVIEAASMMRDVAFRLVAPLCGPGDLPKCGPGVPGKLLLEGNLTQEDIAQDSPLDMAGLRQRCI